MRNWLKDDRVVLESEFGDEFATVKKKIKNKYLIITDKGLELEVFGSQIVTQQRHFVNNIEKEVIKTIKEEYIPAIENNDRDSLNQSKFYVVGLLASVKMLGDDTWITCNHPINIDQVLTRVYGYDDEAQIKIFELQEKARQDKY